VDVGRMANEAYYSKAQNQLKYLGTRGNISSSKFRYMERYLSKTQALQQDWDIKGMTPWRQRLLRDRRHVLDSFLNGFVNASDANNAFQIPGEDFYGSMSGAIEKGVQGGVYNSHETHYLKNYLHRTRVIHNQFTRGDMSGFERSILNSRMNFFNKLLDVYARGDYKPRTPLKG